MRNILIIGAGRSAAALIDYLLAAARTQNWLVTVADMNPEVATLRINGHPNGRPAWLDVLKPNDRADILGRQDLVISLLPPRLHYLLAKDCIKYKKPLITSSFVAREMYRLSPDVLDTPLSFITEMSLDPGLEHFAALQSIQKVRLQGGKIHSFRSYVGDLVREEDFSDNPWKYKFTWNPRSVVLSGQGTSQYVVRGNYKFIPYHRLFMQYRLVEVPNLGTFEAYANSDSLLYRELYELQDIPTVKRSTLRYPGFCDAWHALVKLGLTDDSYPVIEASKMTYRDLVEAHLDSFRDSTASLKERTANFLNIGPSSEIIQRLDWLGIFDRKKISSGSGSPAQILQHLLEERWAMRENDRDLVVLQHVIKYELKGKRKRLTAFMTMTGENKVHTAMSKLVGLPMAMVARRVMEGKMESKGMAACLQPPIYEPILDELKEYGFVFQELLEDM